jgi:uncharacterized protein YjbI with pentapeptide repeats
VHVAVTVVRVDTMKIRGVNAALPSIDESDRLARIDSLETGAPLVADFHHGPSSTRSLQLRDRRFAHGRIDSVSFEAGRFDAVHADRVEVTGCLLANLAWNEGKLSRVRFTRCKILAGQFHRLLLRNIEFDHCKLDLAVFDAVRAVGPVVFTGCSLAEATFSGSDLSGAVFEDCTLRGTVFEPGNYRGCDLRGNDLSGVRGAAHLRKAVLERAQTLQLAHALAAELEIDFADDPSLSA